MVENGKFQNIGTEKPLDVMGAEQPLSDDERALRDEAYSYMQIFINGCIDYHDTMKKWRQVVRMQDPDQDEEYVPEKQKTLQLQTLKSTFNNCVADQLDNMPEANLLPERPGMEETAEDMTDVVRFVMAQNNYEALHRRRVEDYLCGTALTQIVWDADMDDGKGNVALIRWPIESFLWDPCVSDIQESRALIKVSWHPLSWYAAHYPKAAMYIGSDSDMYGRVGVYESWQMLSGDEDRAMMLEYWYRRYDAKRRQYSINVAYLAGGALLESKTDVYKHGKYPFVMEPFDYIEGQPVGDGLIAALAPTMRYINRYAHYIDENLRMSAKNRLLVRKNAQLDMKALCDFDANVIEGQAIDEESVRWFQSKPLSGMATQQMVQFQMDIKQDSGQSQWTRGETAGGVTAAAAISALQEAGGKITREHTLMLNQGFKKIVEQVLWLVSQFYDNRKEQMITGRDGKSRKVMMSAEHLRGDDLPPEGLPPEEIMSGIDEAFPGLGERIRARADKKAKAKRKNSFAPPPYTVQVQVNRRNPLRVQAQNELFIQAYTMSAQSGQSFPLWMLFELLTVDGKDRILPVLKEVDQQTQMLQQLMQENAVLKESNENLKGTVNEMTQQIGEKMPMISDSGMAALKGVPAGKSML